MEKKQCEFEKEDFTEIPFPSDIVYGLEQYEMFLLLFLFNWICRLTIYVMNYACRLKIA